MLRFVCMKWNSIKVIQCFRMIWPFFYMHTGYDGDVFFGSYLLNREDFFIGGVSHHPGWP